MRNKNIKCIILFSLLVGLRGVYGLPEGSKGVTDGGTFSQQGNTMTFTAPDGSIFEHTRFNVESGETVKFVQPSTNARVLNRINSSSLSTINGRVEANGKLYFAAPGGLIFGEGSVIQARHLQAMGGAISDADFRDGRDHYPSLSGSVTNHGLVEADEIVLGGKTVSNSGRLQAGSGSILIATGEGMEISNREGTLAVEISAGIGASSSMAGDLGGHALLQSGILEATTVQLAGSSIQNTGAIKTSDLSISQFTEFDGAAGSISSTRVHLNPQETRFSDADLGGEDNHITNVGLNGAFNSLQVRTNTDLSVVSASGVSNIEVSAQQVDIRTSNGDLSIGVTFAPVFRGSSTPNFLLLASKSGEVEYPRNELVTNYDQVVVYGNNVMNDWASDFETDAQDTFVLNATSLDFDSLSAGLDAATIFKLEEENPSFNLSGSNQISSTEAVEQEGSETSSPPATNLAGVGGPSSGSSNTGGQSIATPEGTPAFSDIVSTQTTGDKLTESQLDAAMNLGLYSRNKYLLQSMPADQVDIMLLAKANGQASVFGGSFDTIDGSSGQETQSVETEAEDTGSEDSEFEEEGDREEAENESISENEKVDGEESSQGIPDAVVPAKIILGTRPLSPISRPVFSPRASAVLEQGLTPRVEEMLKGYSTR